MNPITSSAEDLATLAEIRTWPAYHLVSIYLGRLLSVSQRPRTSGLFLGVGSVVALMRESFPPSASRPVIALALDDPDIELATIAALVDNGFAVVDRPQRWCEGRHVVCNVREAAARQFIPAH